MVCLPAIVELRTESVRSGRSGFGSLKDFALVLLASLGRFHGTPCTSLINMVTPDRLHPADIITSDVTSSAAQQCNDRTLCASDKSAQSAQRVTSKQTALFRKLQTIPHHYEQAQRE